MKNVMHGFVSAFFLMTLLTAPVAAFATVQTGWQQAGWLDDFDVAVKKARSIDRPVLVYFDAVWCSWCQQYKREVLDKPVVKAFLQRHYISVVIDFDSRPDLFNHFGGVGLPLTVILSADGHLVNRFVGVLAEPHFLALLEESRKRSQPLPDREPADADVVFVQALNHKAYQSFRQAFLQHIESLYSIELGTLIGQYETGVSLKRVSPQTWLYLMQHNLWSDRLEQALMVERSRLLDRRDGGFFNFLDTSRSGEDYLESSKLLEANAWLTAWFARAAHSTLHSSAAEPAKQTADMGWFYLRDVLWDKKHGGFWQAQVADNEYYALSSREKNKHSPPPVDKIKRADTNAQAAIALYRAGCDSNNTALKRYAEETLDFILQRLMKDNRLYHLRNHAGVSIAAFPQDWFWVLLAGREIEGGHRERARKMKTVAKQASVWLQQQMDNKPKKRLPVELVSVIARSSCGRNSHFQLPKSSCVWALKQLRIEPETPPDIIVPGLLAWESYLAYSQRQ